MAYNNQVDTLTLEHIAPNVVDSILRANVFATEMLSKTKDFTAATIDFPLKWKTGTAVQSFSGFDVLPTSFTDTRVTLKYNPRFTAANVALALTDVSANNTPAKVLSLVEVEMMSRAQDLSDDIGRQFYADGTGNANKEMIGLANIVDDTSSIGGLSRSTYAPLASTNTAAASGLLSLFKMRTLTNAVSDATVIPTKMYTSYEVWALFEQLLQPQERIMKEINVAPNFKGYTGFNALSFAGLPVIADRKATSGIMFALNTDYLHFYGLRTFSGSDSSGGYSGSPVKVGGKLFTGNQYAESTNLGFFYTGLIKSSNQLAYNSYMVIGGNLVTENPRRHGKLTGITSI
jgi:hypothetical protein